MQPSRELQNWNNTACARIATRFHRSLASVTGSVVNPDGRSWSRATRLDWLSYKCWAKSLQEDDIHITGSPPSLRCPRPDNLDLVLLQPRLLTFDHRLDDRDSGIFEVVHPAGVAFALGVLNGERQPRVALLSIGGHRGGTDMFLRAPIRLKVRRRDLHHRGSVPPDPLWPDVRCKATDPFEYESQHNVSTTLVTNRSELWGVTGDSTNLVTRGFPCNTLLLTGFGEGRSGMSSRLRKPKLHRMGHGTARGAPRQRPRSCTRARPWACRDQPLSAATSRDRERIARSSSSAMLRQVISYCGGGIIPWSRSGHC